MFLIQVSNGLAWATAYTRMGNKQKAVVWPDFVLCLLCEGSSCLSELCRQKLAPFHCCGKCQHIWATAPRVWYLQDSEGPRSGYNALLWGRQSGTAGLTHWGAESRQLLSPEHSKQEMQRSAKRLPSVLLPLLSTPPQISSMSDFVVISPSRKTTSSRGNAS